MNSVSQAVRIGLGAWALGASLAAQAAPPVITNITMVGATPQFAVQSDLGIPNQTEYSTNLSQKNWVVLTNLWVAQTQAMHPGIVLVPRFQNQLRFTHAHSILYPAMLSRCAIGRPFP
jgi:hypothetical protein